MDVNTHAGGERRYYTRLKKKMDVRFRLESEAGDKVHHGITSNISLGGICLEVDDEKEEIAGKVESGEEKLIVSIAFDRPDQTATINASTSWVSSHLDWMKRQARNDQPLRMGLSFSEDDSPARSLIKSYIVDSIPKKIF